MSSAAQLVELTCPSCGRKTKQAEGAVLARLQQGKVLRCLICATELKLPAELKAKGDAPPPPAPVRRLGKCPLCLQPAQATGQATLVRGWCNSCSVPFLCERPGSGSFDLPAASRAELAEVEQAAARLARVPVGGVLARALRTRCERGSIEAGEATRLADMIEGLSRWRLLPGEAVVPWVPAEVQHILGPFVFLSSHVSVDAERDLIYLRNEMMLGADSPGMSDGTKAALNVVGIGLLLATGTGFTVSGQAKPPEVLSQEYWVRLSPAPAGCALSVATAQNGSNPQPMSPAEQAELAQRLMGLRGVLERYARALVLCSGDLRGASSRRLAVEAVCSRLLDLGVPSAQVRALADEFTVGAAAP